jgi:predicted Zn-dependent protease with MMP-like domain
MVMMVNEQQFDQMVAEAWEKIPGRFKKEIENLSVVVESRPNQMQLSRVKVNGILLGLFEGVPKTAWGQATMGVRPSKITLFRETILLYAKDEKALKNKIQEVLMHEIGHYFGYNEDALFVMDRKLRQKLSKEAENGPS